MINLNNISFAYNKKKIFVNTNIVINEGEFVFIVGESGIGKTTLLKLIYFDLKPQKGIVKSLKYNSDLIDNSEIPELRKEIGIVFQDFKLLNDRNVYDNIALPLFIAGEKGDIIKKKVYNTASGFGILDSLKLMPFDISGGEQQRVCIARAMINEPKIFIADEPTGNLDPFVSSEIFKLINEINMKGTTCIVATHNFEIVRKYHDKRILQVKDNKLFDVRIKT